MIEFNIKDTGWFTIGDDDDSFQYICLSNEQGRELYNKLKKIYWPITIVSPKLSNCCRAPVHVEGDTTHYYKCALCYKPCDTI